MTNDNLLKTAPLNTPYISTTNLIHHKEIRGILFEEMVGGVWLHLPSDLQRTN